jgi:hypothetical protein
MNALLFLGLFACVIRICWLLATDDEPKRR